tara:strand:+ start:407 stop:793 length:387 start_codon:yes stop_codon:yes gene_type:complete
MKFLFENWRQWMSDEEKEFLDIGMPTIRKNDIIRKPNINPHQKNTLLDFFVKLNETADEASTQNILKTIYAHSGFSDDFDYSTKEDALEDYYTPYRYEGASLKDWHQKIKKAVHARTRHTKPMDWGNK